MSDFIDGFCAPVGPLKALTPAGVSRITGLEFRRVDTNAELPPAPGPYVWASSWEGPSFYFGSGSGGKGLRGRVGNEFRWRREYLEWLAEGDPFDTGAVTQVPLVRVVSELGLTCFAAEARVAPWVAALDGTAQAPETAQEWERFVQEASALLTGHRSIIGGGAWENKNGTLGDRMQAAALTRLRHLRDAE